MDNKCIRVLADKNQIKQCREEIKEIDDSISQMSKVLNLAGNEVRLPQQANTWWAVAYLVVIGSGVVFTLYVVVLRYWDASRVNYGFVIIPIVTVLISAWLLDEQLTRS